MEINANASKNRETKETKMEKQQRNGGINRASLGKATSRSIW